MNNPCGSHYRKPLHSNPTPASSATSIAAPDAAPALLPAPLLSVLPCGPPPFWPFDVARTEGLIVPMYPVADVVGNVIVLVGEDSSNAASDRKTSAKPGAGTSTSQVPADWSQLIVCTVSVPLRRPSTSNRLPRVYQTGHNQVRADKQNQN